RAHAACRQSVIVVVGSVTVAAPVAVAVAVAAVATTVAVATAVIVPVVVVAAVVAVVIIVLVRFGSGAERHGDRGAGARLRAGRRGGGDHVPLRHAVAVRAAAGLGVEPATLQHVLGLIRRHSAHTRHRDPFAVDVPVARVVEVLHVHAVGGVGHVVLPDGRGDPATVGEAVELSVDRGVLHRLGAL